MARPVFVFGSNLSGIHASGAARWAYENRDAEWGAAFGLTGTSFAIPVMDWDIQRLPLKEIRKYVRRFLTFVAARPDLTFELTPIGCAPGGYTPAEIAPLFRDAPANIVLPEEFRTILAPSPAADPAQT
ncbi:hypothetical protein FHS55_003630 [Angulomicrobium tetraedrale]|uniref:Uncharacterized protein n=1 Tax=Ancylobacter tetraedralis TaxID=217068 RepID=A0A839ZED5_9HYPH|nr:hypothetical protein [Ancylobacter tetraedralis]MBB3773005.1 hypothetical protein [Ancylobacter tetraedralis]